MTLHIVVNVDVCHLQLLPKEIFSVPQILKMFLWISHTTTFKHQILALKIWLIYIFFSNLLFTSDSVLFRCLFVAHSYLLAKKWREAVSLYNRVLSHATSAVTHFQEISSNSQVYLVFHFTVCLGSIFATSV